MKIKGIIAEDFINYKKPAMVIEFPYCDFKCDKECGMQVCQNSSLVDSPTYDISAQKIVQMYLKNDITKAIVFQGLEPFDSAHDLYVLIGLFRKFTKDDIVIYTGYTEQELAKRILDFQKLFRNITIKFGRFVPNKPHHFDAILGVTLTSPNQYGKKVC